MPLYECIYYINPTATLPQTALTMKKLSEVVFKHNGVVRSLSNQGIIPLAYPMRRYQRKQTKARLVVMLFDCSSRGFLDFRKELEREEFVFRWMIQKQKNEFRPKDDSLYYHKGFEANDAIFEKLEDVRAQEFLKLSDQIAENNSLKATESAENAPAEKTLAEKRRAKKRALLKAKKLAAAEASRAKSKKRRGGAGAGAASAAEPSDKKIDVETVFNIPTSEAKKSEGKVDVL